jgi:hypothetical protein
MRPISFALAAAAMLSASCGGGQPLRDGTVDDLPGMVLQREDVPSGLVERVAIADSSLGSKPGLAQPGEFGSVASYAAEFVRPSERAESGQLTCVTSLSALFNGSTEASNALAQARDLLLSDPEAEEERREPQVGDESFTFHLKTGPLSVCRSYEDGSGQGKFLLFRIGKNLGVLNVGYFEGPANADQFNGSRNATATESNINFLKNRND